MAHTTPDVIYTGGWIFAPGSDAPVRQGVAVSGALITAVSTDLEIEASAGTETLRVDLAGGLLVPGFQDAHIHPVAAGIELLQCDLAEIEDAAQSLAAIAAYAQANPDEPWILGGGWSMDHFPGGTPTRQMLDAIVPDRPVLLSNRDHHGSWANTRAIELAGLDENTPDPVDGRLEREPNGFPAGTFHEGAMNLLDEVRPVIDAGLAYAGLLKSQAVLMAQGITGWQDAAVGAVFGTPDTLETYARALAEDTLKVHVVGALWWERNRGLEQLENLISRRDALMPGASGSFSASTVKIMVDGVAENFTAAMISPYCDGHGHHTENSGLSFIDPELLKEYVSALDANGFNCHFHAVGNRGVREALDAVEAARAANGPKGGRHHIAHIQVIAAEDTPRFVKLGVSVNMQPLWACHEDQLDELTLPFMAPGSADRHYPFGELEATGAHLAAGSDWPVSSANPIAGIHVAVNRTSPGSGLPALGEERQKLSLSTAHCVARLHRGYGIPQRLRGQHRVHRRGLPGRSGGIDPQSVRARLRTDPHHHRRIHLDPRHQRLFSRQLAMHADEENNMPRKKNFPRRGRPMALAASLAAGALLLAGCGGGAKEAGPKEPAAFEMTDQTPAANASAGTIKWAIYAEPATLDYTHAFDYPDNQVLANVCDSLLRWNSNLTISPGLAEKFSNPTPLTWVYQIRPGVKFHDGTGLTAKDVEASLNRHLDPKVNSYWFSAYQQVKSIKATGPMEVTVTTNVPDSQFNNAMAASPGVIESAATLAQAGADYGNPSTGVNCTGPFELTKWNSGSSIETKKFDGYWDKELTAKSDGIDFVFLPDSNARINALKSGEIDGTWQVPSNAIGQLQAGGSGKVLFGLNTTVMSEVVGDTEGVLGDKRVRQALLMALDRKNLVAAAEQGYATVTDALTTKSTWAGVDEANVDAAFDGLDKYDFDLEGAKKLLADAGAEGREVTIVSTNITPGMPIVAQAFGAAATSIGLKPKIETVSPDKYTTLFSDPAARKGFDLFTTSWYLSTPDPLEMYSVLRTGDFSNYGNWSNKTFDKTVNEAIQVMDPNGRAKLSAEAQKITNDELPWLPLYETPNTVYLNDRITGLSPAINFLYYPWAATLGTP
ncbi:ABC transporter substrate-binding protein [Paeniglutamicibacter cryotolerans]|uniref:Putative amidohydrolase YtcJ/ABC-type transport system substrate-binding protein n=2 Tax=Paeniglutamicibacter cryotolerans TaxID=670079 RepID=A0A839QGA0_9MICC|nr:putative amidohydrolase YtcJ/ABC-type transport system substrate-binding protein [Paeniglutamicibacter cryotolerans]